MSDIFCIFVTEKEIVIRIFTIKTPRRWAKRQRDMRKMRMCENTIKDLGTLNRGQSMILNVYIKGHTHAQLDMYRSTIEIIVFVLEPVDLTVAEMIIRDLMADGDTLSINLIEGSDGSFQTIQWCGHLIETEEE